MDKVDFRSDTITWPTAAMRLAMAEASVGDDVYGEDPTVNELEALAAERIGCESGLFVASGTMGNIVAILTHANRGDEAIIGIDAHAFRSEGGGMARLGGIIPKPIPTDRFGHMSLTDIKKAISPDDPHYAYTRLILVENSYGVKSGYPLPPDYFADVQAIARRKGLKVHMDGARIFNASVALGVDVKQMTQHVDSVTFCLSKGLCAPVGSVLCGSANFIEKARRERKVLGGGMRQAGFLAAAGIVALNEMVDRLADDHLNARILANGLSNTPGIKIDLSTIKTNIVFFELDETVDIRADDVADILRIRANLWIDVDGDRRLRAVTHYWVGEGEVELLLKHIGRILERHRSS